MTTPAAPTPPAVALATLAKVVRSKNAGPMQLTLDIFFHDRAGFDRAVAAAGLQPDAVAARYRVGAGQVRRFDLPDVLAIKFSMPRQRCAGDPGDGDVYGAQQHVPLLGVML